MLLGAILAAALAVLQLATSVHHLLRLSALQLWCNALAA
jgi:hypothetical protein